MGKRTTTTREYNSNGLCVKEVVTEEDTTPQQHYCNCYHWHGQWHWYNNPYAPVTTQPYVNTWKITSGVPAS